MSMLGSQADRLRLTADVISERGVTSGDLAIIEIRLREAADTIESLRDRLQVVSETCENVYPGNPIDRHMMFQCSACGHVQTNGTYPPEWWNAEHTDDECVAYDGEPIRFCPHCGRKAVDA